MTAICIEKLQKPLPLWSPKSWYYGGIKALMSSVGKCANGISIGYTYGFDSGVMLEYIYQNQAKGKFAIGPVIDRLYLNAPGWKGIRNRGALLSKTLSETIVEKSQTQQTPVRVVDLACGGGRYVLEALKDLPQGAQYEVELRDYRRENVETTKALAAQMGVNVTVRQADAFSDFDLEPLYNHFDIVIVSGLHEIVEDNTLVENHFHQIFKILRAGGTLINTIQPNHPQLEFIARVLPSHTGHMWAMRLRSIEQTKSWIRRAGFALDKCAMEDQNIFGRITAHKR